MLVAMAVWLLLLQLCMVTAVTYIEDTHEVDRSKGEFSHLTIEKETKRIFVGAMNALYEFDRNLNKVQEIVTGPKMDNPLCNPRILGSSNKCDCDDCTEKLMENYNKGLVIDYDHDHLISCSSLYHGYCEKYELKDIRNKVQPTSYWPVVANNATASTFIFIAPGPVNDENNHQSNVLYVGATRTINGPLVTRDRFVPAFCSRKLDGNPAFKFVYQDSYTSTKIQIESQKRGTFPIHYIYGFSDDHFSYMITVQKSSPIVESYITKIFRVCNNDHNFYSYTEVQLQCKHNAKWYNLSQAAFFGKAGIKLARAVGQGEDYLFVVFATGGTHSAETNADSTSALCIYPLHKIKNVFTQNIQQCFSGYGNTGPAHVISASLCLETKFDIDDNYCGTHNFNYYIDGTIAIEAEAAAMFDYVASSVTIDIVNDYTVAFIGTSNGHLLKVSLEGQSNGSIYEDVAIDEGNKINADMFIDGKPGQYVYVMTPRKLLKTMLYNCSQYDSCVTCLGARDPYCGWCSLANKCSLKTECPAYNQKLSWLPYISVSCPRIESVVPNATQINPLKTTMLDVTVSHLQTVTTGNYVCQFRYGNGSPIKTTNSSLQAHTGNSSNVIRCETPESFRLPPIPTGEDHIVMDLSVEIGRMKFDVTKFTFFDCGLHKETACTGCTLSSFPCTWCVNNHICTHNPTKECLSNTLITGKHAVSQAASLVGPEACPRIELEGTLNGRLLVPSGTKMKITVKAIHLKNFQLPLKCFFRLTPPVTVDASVSNVAGEEWDVLCDEVNFKYHGDTSQINVPFQIEWSASNALDNPEKIQVIMYKCDAMAKTCGDCLLMDHSYKCGWCGDKCTTSQCPREKWHDHNSTCPDPEITQIEPLTGPINGGTKLTITGKNLGKEESDVLGGVTVAGVVCNLESYEPPSKIVCITEPYVNKKSGEVTVYVGNLYQAVAPQLFTYVTPILESITPGSGPVSGGTKVTIGGQHLDAGSEVTIRIKDYPCYVIHEERTKNSMVCKTSSASSEDLNKFLFVEAEFDKQTVTSAQRFKYINDPVVNQTKKRKAIVSGGIPIELVGKYLNTVQHARMIIEDTSVNPVKTYYSECKPASKEGTSMTCYSPQLPNTTIDADKNPAGKQFRYYFEMDNIIINRTGEDPLDVFTIFADPIFKAFPGSKEKALKKADYLTINGENLNGITEDDVRVRVGTGFCNVTSIPPSGTSLLCKPPPKQPKSLQGSKYPEVIVEVGRNYSKLIGYLKYETEELPLSLIIGIVAGVLLVGVCFFLILWCVKRREQMTIQKKWQIQMDNLEGKVAKECKEAFAELLTDMTDLANNDIGKASIPFLDYRSYCMRVLFPQDEDTHPVVRELEIEYSKRDNIERGLKLFSQLVSNKTFLLNFVRTLESNKKFQMRDRVNVASLISVALQTKMEYATEILKMLLAELIEKSVDGKNHPRLLLRRTESVAEKMLTNWFTFLLYKFLRECAGETLFVLYEAIKQQVSKGPVDYFTSEARYSLSEDKLIRQQVDYILMTIHVRDLDQFSQSHPVKVLDCDTITQVKEKILDAIYKNAPFSSRPAKETVDLVLYAQSPSPEWENSLKQQRLILFDLDQTSKTEGEYKRFNTLAHYQVPDGAFMALVPKQSSQSIVNLSSMSDKSSSSKPWDYQRLGDSNYQYTGRSPSLNRTGSPSSAVDLENGTGNGVKYYHLVKQHDSESNKEGDRTSKMVSEVFLTRLLATKGTLQSFVNDLFERIFSTTHRGNVLPLAIKYMFDFLDDQALLHNIQDPDVVHTWKSNSLPLRFWVNVIKNPNFVFDIYKSNIVDSCLSVVAQNFMDSCSMSEVRLGKDSPSSKLLYAKHIPEYKKWVERYYQDIKMMPAISDQDMTAMMAEESRTHQDEFNTNAALLELYKYVQQYNEELIEALDEDEFARKNRLNLKLEQVQIAMNGEAYC